MEVQKEAARAKTRSLKPKFIFIQPKKLIHGPKNPKLASRVYPSLWQPVASRNSAFPRNDTVAEPRRFSLRSDHHFLARRRRRRRHACRRQFLEAFTSEATISPLKSNPLLRVGDLAGGDGVHRRWIPVQRHAEASAEKLGEEGVRDADEGSDREGEGGERSAKGAAMQGFGGTTGERVVGTGTGRGSPSRVSSSRLAHLRTESARSSHSRFALPVREFSL